jgi:hypothetical protein
MNPIFAIAGQGEAAIGFGQFVCWCALFVIAVLLFFAWYRESWRFALGAATLALVLGAFFQPWNAFLPPPQGFAYWLDDPDYVYWRGRERLVCAAWVVVFAVAALALVHYARHKPREIPIV